MSRMLGMDPVQAQGFAARIRSQASDVRGLVDEITRMLAEVKWFGNNAQKFQDEWRGPMVAELSSAIETLENQAAQLDQHAQNQIAVSGG